MLFVRYIPCFIAQSLMSQEAPSLGQSREAGPWTKSYNGLQFLLASGFTWTFLPLGHLLCWTVKVHHSPIAAISWPSFPWHIIRRHEAQLQVGSSYDIPSCTVPSCSAVGKPVSLLQQELVSASMYARLTQQLESWKEWVSKTSYWPCWSTAWPQAAGQDSMALQFEDHGKEVLLLSAGQ